MGYYSSGDGNPFLGGQSMSEQVSNYILKNNGDCRTPLLFLAYAFDAYMAQHEEAHVTKRETDPRQYVLPLSNSGPAPLNNGPAPL